MKCDVTVIDCPNPCTIVVVVADHVGVTGEVASAIAGLGCDKKLSMASPVPVRRGGKITRLLYALGFIVSRPPGINEARLLNSIEPIALRRGGYAVVQVGCCEFLSEFEGPHDFPKTYDPTANQRTCDHPPITSEDCHELE